MAAGSRESRQAKGTRVAPMKLRYAGSTHVGMKRTHNEDSFIMVPAEYLYVVADGMGGHACGEVASRMTVETMRDFFQTTTADDEVTWPCKMDSSFGYQANRLVAAVKLANLRIHEKAQSDSKFRGMGTTVVCALFHGSEVHVAHVGDSRLYRLRDGALALLTEDHSLLNDYKKMTTLTEEEERNFPHKNIIVRALGMKDTVAVDVVSLEPRPGDVFLLCSDGLSGEVEDDRMRDILIEAGADLEAACDSLIQEACDNGGKDNVTAVIVQVAE
jgi:protein phosphatase